MNDFADVKAFALPEDGAIINAYTFNDPKVVTKIYLQNDSKDLFRCKSNEHIFFLYLLNDDLLLTCMIHIRTVTFNLVSHT